MWGWGGRFPYSAMSEKSAVAEVRQAQATATFDAARVALERAVITNKVRLVRLGCGQQQQQHSKNEEESSSSSSLFARLPTVCVEHILDYFFQAPVEVAEPVGPIGAMVRAETNVALSSSLATAPKKQKRNSKKQDETKPPAAAAAAVQAKPRMPVDEIMQQLYTPGNKIILPITTPNCHLTGPCWRDFSRYVRSSGGGGGDTTTIGGGGGAAAACCWNVKRIATGPERQAFRESSRRGPAYFIHAIYTVPGVAAQDDDEAPNKKKKRAKKRKAPPPPSSSSSAAVAHGVQTDNKDDDDDVDADCKPRAKKLKRTATTTTKKTSTTTATTTTLSLQPE